MRKRLKLNSAEHSLNSNLAPTVARLWIAFWESTNWNYEKISLLEQSINLLIGAGSERPLAEFMLNESHLPTFEKDREPYSLNQSLDRFLCSLTSSGSLDREE